MNYQIHRKTLETALNFTFNYVLYKDVSLKILRDFIYWNV